MAIRRTFATLACVLLLAGCGGSSSTSTTNSQTTGTSATQTTPPTTGPKGFEGVAIESGTDLASPGTTRTHTVDGITCAPSEALVYHIHAHLQVFVAGTPRAVPGGIGIPGSRIVQTVAGPVAFGGQCIYWLHTHAPDGIIHVESPKQRVYTLGNFFDVWHQALSSSHVGAASGKVTALVSGKPWARDVRSIPLIPHAVIQLSVGTPVVPFNNFSWTGLRL